MIVIGITGGTGSGKGFVCERFTKYNINSLDTDIVSRSVCYAGSDCLDELVSYFGSQILNEDGTLNRKLLANIAFTDKEKHSALNSITHKYILKEICNWINTQKKAGAKYAIVDAPMLFESGTDKLCDVIISVIASEEIRIQRVLKRDNIHIDEVKNRIKRQHDDEFYIKNSDYTITNDGDTVSLDKQIDIIYNSITNLEKTKNDTEA